MCCRRCKRTVYCRRVDLLVLGSDKHARDPDQLQLTAIHRHVRKEAVNVVDRQIECLRLEPVFFGNLDEPIDEDAAHRVFMSR